MIDRAEGKKHLYSIGEAARITGVSVQTLRNYSNAGLLKPDAIDEENGYRYYSFQQFHYIDRIKYLRSLDMPLADIQNILQEGDIEKMQQLLEKQRLRIEEERNRINEMYEGIQWYQSYFSYLQQYDFDHVPYIVNLDTRYVLDVEYREDDTVESVETRLASLKNSEGLDQMKYRRQYGYIADFAAMMEGMFHPEKYFVYIKEKKFNHPNIMELPAGTYICFRAKICAEEWNPKMLEGYFKKYNKPVFVVANEYEDNLIEYHHCPYEVQILLEERIGVSYE